ncbi:MAG TPA: hypothetical protein PKC69_02860 [Chitinophagaceae bacterium]|nr:hypothetical protein [Chitinophagaceae bacterium]
MMTLKQMYGYLFYKLYRFWEKVSTPKLWSDWKAGIAILALEVWFLVSVQNYYEVLTKKELISSPSSNPLTFIILAVLIIIKLIMFEYQGRWKRYIAEFDKWPEKKNRRGTMIVWSIIFLIIANLIFSFYLMSQIDWKQYR